MLQSLLEVAGQQLIVAYFLITGVSNLTKASVADHVERMAAHGVPFPRATFWLGIALELAGCALVLLDWHPALGVGCLIAFTLAATAIFHRFWRKQDPVQRNFSRINLLGNLAVLGGLLLLLSRLR